MWQNDPNNLAFAQCLHFKSVVHLHFHLDFSGLFVAVVEEGMGQDPLGEPFHGESLVCFPGRLVGTECSSA